MRCLVYAGNAGMVLVPDCMRASHDAEHMYGPLQRCGAFETDVLDESLRARIDGAFDDRSYALVDADLALRLSYVPEAALLLPPGFEWSERDWWNDQDEIDLLLDAAEPVAVAKVLRDDGGRGWYAYTFCHRPWQFRGQRVTGSRAAALHFLTVWAVTHAAELRRSARVSALAAVPPRRS